MLFRQSGCFDMKFEPTLFEGVYLIEIEKLSDARGFFARSFCEKEFSRHGLQKRTVQCNISFNNRAGTLRGMHFQRKPHEEAKLVRCTAGAIYDVIIDLREGSKTFSKWSAFELTADHRNALYIPEGFAHGFQTLVDNTEVFYHMFDFFEPSSASGVRWDDPAFNIDWPREVSVISEKDKSYPRFRIREE